MSSTTHHSGSGTPISDGGLTPGQTFDDGRYLLKKVLGLGGMGVVWLAYDKRLRESVALKFLPSQISFDPAALEDLRRETLRSRKLSHPNIVRIHDLHEGRDEPTFISMEYVDGPNLHFLRANRPAQILPWKFLAPLVRQLCEALDYAHGERVIHRDLKPANLMLDSNSRLKLADFGLACVISDSMTRLSGKSEMRGTLGFMSPQQADGKKAQVTDDIYALGATLYDLLTSRPPFHAGDIAYQIRHTRPDHMGQRLADLELTNDIPSEVSAMVMACLAKDSAQRPQSARAILDWLDVSEGKSISTPAAVQLITPPVPDIPNATAPPQTVPPIRLAVTPSASIPPEPPTVPAPSPVPPALSGSEWLPPPESNPRPVRPIVLATVFGAMGALVAVGLAWWFLQHKVAENKVEVAPTVPNKVLETPAEVFSHTPIERVRTPAPVPDLPAGVGAEVGRWESRSTVLRSRIYHTAVWTGKEMIVFGGGAEGNYRDDHGAYDPARDKWRLLSKNGAPPPRWAHAGFWIGNEMLIWGGRSQFDLNTHKNDGARYNPVSDSWRPISSVGAPAPRSQMVSVWTGSEMLVWSGLGMRGIILTDGARYNPATDRWTPMAQINAPGGRFESAYVWTGTELIVWGGMGPNRQNTIAGGPTIANGARYNPKSNTWRSIATAGAPPPTCSMVAVWSGQEMLLWAGEEVVGQGYNVRNTGWRYNPVTDTWKLMSTRGAPPASGHLLALWSGSEMLVWGGRSEGNRILNSGGLYNPVTDSWTLTSMTGAPSGRGQGAAVSTGEGMLMFGGSTGGFTAYNSTDYFLRNAKR